MQEFYFWLSKSHTTECGHQLLVTMSLIKKSICYEYCLCDRRVTAGLKRVSKFCDFFFRCFFQQICFQIKNISSACLKKINSCFGKKKLLARRSKREAIRRFSLPLFRGEPYINFHTQYDVRGWRDYH